MVDRTAGRQDGRTASPSGILELLREVKDPEVPVLDIVELGIVRGAQVQGDDVRVDITPTYSGCPALRVIEDEIITTLAAHGYHDVSVRTVLHPAWTTDWMSEEARGKLLDYGIAPPGPAERTPVLFGPTVRQVGCPWCGSADTELRSEFGATACKSLLYCNACHQPFEHFKAI